MNRRRTSRSKKLGREGEKRDENTTRAEKSRIGFDRIPGLVGKQWLVGLVAGGSGSGRRIWGGTRTRMWEGAEEDGRNEK